MRTRSHIVEPIFRARPGHAARPRDAGKKVQLLVAEHYNHFELPETLCNPYGLLGRAALDLMGLTAGVR